MDKKIRVAILDDHPAIVHGYVSMLKEDPQIEVTATLEFGDELEPILKKHAIDVLLLDINVPTSKENKNPYPILHIIPKILQAHSNVKILIISMHAERGIIRAVMEAGANGYILKDDQATFKKLGSVVKAIATDSFYFSPIAREVYAKLLSAESKNNDLLTPRQLEVLSLYTTYPDDSTTQIAKKMSISDSTVRNLLSGAYVRLEVHNRTAAISKARQMGLITPHQQTL